MYKNEGSDLGLTGEPDLTGRTLAEAETEAVRIQFDEEGRNV